MRQISFLLFFTFFSFTAVLAQNNAQVDSKESSYIKAIDGRAEKIVANLTIEDAAKAACVKNIVADQYRALNDIQTKRDAQIKVAKSADENKEAVSAKVKTYQDIANAEIEKLHKGFIESLSKKLDPQQVDKVKDGMTYNVVDITYKGYLAMIPALTDKQKEQIKDWLIEAREHAMDAESSEKKHAWFGKYKGRINNYLSAQGYDLKKEGEDWEMRRKAAERSVKN